MKIVYVTVSFPFGPGETFLIPELRELVARGHQILIVPLRPGRQVIHADAAEFVAYTRQAPLLSFSILRDAAGAFGSNLLAAAPILRLLLDPRDPRTLATNASIVPKGLWLSAIAREWCADHIHAYWASSVASAAFLAGECAHIPWSFTAHRHDIARNNLLTEKARHAAFVRVISESGLRMLRAALGDLASKAFVLHAGIQIPPTPSRTKRDGRLTAFCPANLLPVKGHRYLIDAVAMLRNAGVDMELWIAGDGELRGQIERQIRERHLERVVRLLGQMPHGDLFSLYQDGEVDVVVLPSIDLGNGHHEGIPVSLMEAMAYAIPVISTETGGIPELVGGGAGMLVPPANPKALADALNKLVVSDDLGRSLGLAGRKRVRESFEVSEIVTELVQRFNQPQLNSETAQVREKPATSRLQKRESSVGFGIDTASTIHSRLRIGVVMEGADAPLWVHQTIEEIGRAEHLELKLLVMSAAEGTPKSSSPALLRAWSWADRRLFKPTADGLRRERRSHAIDTVISSGPKRDGEALTMSKVDEAKIKAAKLDVIVNLASIALPLDIADATKYGVWTFVSPNGAAGEVDSAGFRDFCEGHAVAALILRATHAGGECDLYRSSFSKDKLSLYQNQNVACWLKSEILLRRLADLYQKGWPSIQVPTAAPASVAETTSKPVVAGNATIARFVAGLSIRAFWRLVKNGASSERWFIAYRDKRAGSSASIKTLMPPTGWDYADPFLYERLGKHYIFFEVANSSKPKGEIWFVELDENGNPGPPQPALTRDYHLSYPMVFDWQGETYLLPESSQNSSVDVYRAVEFPRRWEFAGTLLAKMQAVDSTLFERNGKLWLFGAGIGGQHLKCSELSLFFSDSLLGPWIPHAKNPIVCDIRRARPAGSLFYRGGELIRPAQDCSECYGHAITLNRVEMLSETDYQETPVAKILPDWAARLSATHTLNMNSRYEVRDAKLRTARYGFAANVRSPRISWPEGHALWEKPYRGDALLEPRNIGA